jgi:hypothetical protein
MGLRVSGGSLRSRSGWRPSSSLYRSHFAEREVLVDDKDEPATGLVQWDRAEGRAAKLRQSLGLDPQSLAKLLNGLAKTLNVDGTNDSGLEAGRQPLRGVHGHASYLDAVDRHPRRRPGVAGGTDACAWSSLSNTTIENPLPSRSTSQYPATKPGAEVILGRMSLVRASAAAEA